MKRTPLMLQVKPKIDYSVYAGVLIIIERSACGIRPVGVGFRTGRYNFITPFHMFSREKVDYGIASPENYDALLDEVDVAYLPSEVTASSWIREAAHAREQAMTRSPSALLRWSFVRPVCRCISKAFRLASKAK